MRTPVRELYVRTLGSDGPASSSQAPPAQHCFDPGVSSRGTERQKIDRQHLVTTKEGEKVIMNQLLSSREFNRNMKDLIARLFYTKDPQTDQTRTTDHWVQTPTHWIHGAHNVMILDGSYLSYTVGQSNDSFICFSVTTKPQCCLPRCVTLTGELRTNDLSLNNFTEAAQSSFVVPAPSREA